jgi:hypothetical protein
MGLIVTDDVVKRSVERDPLHPLPLMGSLVIRLKKPIPCVFFSYGLCGVSMRGVGLCAIGDGWNGIVKEERFALANLMRIFDPDGSLSLRMQWFLLDMHETEARILRNPTDEEIVMMFKDPATMKKNERLKYKLISRIVRRRSTSGINVLDGHEDDSDRDPLMLYLDEMSMKEQRAEFARKKRLGRYPDNEIGKKMSRLFPRPLSSSRSSRIAISSSDSMTVQENLGDVDPKKDKRSSDPHSFADTPIYPTTNLFGGDGEEDDDDDEDPCEGNVEYSSPDIRGQTDSQCRERKRMSGHVSGLRSSGIPHRIKSYQCKPPSGPQISCQYPDTIIPHCTSLDTSADGMECLPLKESDEIFPVDVDEEGDDDILPVSDEY